jgi:hypothetical protein
MEVPGVAAERDQVATHPMMRLQDGSLVSQNEGTAIVNAIEELVGVLKRVRSLVRALLNERTDPPAQNDAELSLEFDVRLPDTTSAAEFHRDVGDFVHVLDTTSRAVVGAGVSFRGVDSGSAWLRFLADNWEVATFLPALLTAAALFFRERRQYKEVMAKVEKLPDTGSFLEDMRESVKKGLDATLEYNAKVLADEHATAKEKHEAQTRIMQAVQVAADCYERGGQVHHALHAPSGKVDVQFPNLPELLKDVKVPKQLAAAKKPAKKLVPEDA